MLFIKNVAYLVVELIPTAKERNDKRYLNFTFANFPKKVRREKKLVELLVISV